MAAQPNLPAWLTPERLLAWCRVLAAGEAVWAALLLRRSGLLPTDFACFWSAANLALHAGPRAAYDLPAIAAAEHQLQPLAANLFEPFLYPPSFLLLCLPLGLLPPLAAAAGFTAAGVALFLSCLRRLMPKTWPLLPALAFPGVLVTAGTGQNGFFTAACFGGGALLLETRPFAAGLCLGALSCKPHLGVLVPLALLAARRWRALAGVAVSASGLAALSWLVFGSAVWLEFPHAVVAASHVLAGALIHPSQLQSLFGAALVLHAPLWLGMALQLWLSLVAAALLVHIVSERPGPLAEMATLSTATLLASPYSMDYDLAILAIPLAWLCTDAARRAWRPWEIGAAMTAYMMPLLTSGMARQFGVPLAPLCLAALTLVIAGRATRGEWVHVRRYHHLVHG